MAQCPEHAIIGNCTLREKPSNLPGLTDRWVGKCLLVIFVALMANGGASAQPIGPRLSEPPTALIRDGAWRDFKYRLLVRGAADGKSTVVDVKAKSTSYRVPGAGYGFRLVVLHDQRTNTTRVMPGIAGRKDFYVSTDGGILGVHLSDSGDLYLARSFAELPGSVLDLEEAEKRFESEFDETKAGRHLSRTVSMGLRTATGPGIFWLPGAPSAEVTVRAETNGSLLHLELANPKTEKTASLWIDLKAYRIVRAIDTAGQERRNVASTKVWTTTTGQLMVSGTNGTQEASQPMDVSVRTANFYILGTGEEFSVAALTDPLTKKVTFLNDDQFFVSMGTGMISLSTRFGRVTFRRQFFQAPDAGNIDTTLGKFAETFEPAAVRRASADAIRVPVANVVGFSTRGSSQLIDPRLEHVDLSDGILHLVLNSERALLDPSEHAIGASQRGLDIRGVRYTGQTAAVWVDIRPGSPFLQRMVRAELGGQVRPVPPIWFEGKARLVPSGKPARLEDLSEVEAKYARLRSADDLLLTVMHDIRRKSVSIVTGFYDYFRTTTGVLRNPDTTFYVPRRDGLLGVIIFGGTVRLSPAYFVAPVSTGGPDAAIASFERSFDRDTLERRIAAHTLDLGNAKGTEEVVFRDGRTEGTAPPRVDAIDLQGNTLRLVLTDPLTRRTATLWIDVNNCRVTRLSIEGSEVRSDSRQRQQQ